MRPCEARGRCKAWRLLVLDCLPHVRPRLRPMAEASSLDLRSAMPGFLAKTGALSLSGLR